MARASGRLRFSADTTSSPLPSPSRKSTTANAGGALPIWARPSDTLSQDVTVKPRVSMARDRRSRKGLSSSTIRSERSAWPVSSAMVFTVWRSLYLILSRYGVTTRRCQGRIKSITPIRRPGLALTCGFSSGFTGLETAARPGDLNHGAVIRKGPVGEGNLGAGALEQRAGDEHPETEAAMIALGFVDAPARQIRLADTLQYVGRETRAIVGNDDLDGLGVPPRIHFHRRPREIDGVFQDVADAMEDCRIARADRLAGARDRNPDLDRDAEIAIRRHRFLDQRRQWHAVERRAGCRQLRDLGQDIAAPLRLFAQGLDVAGQWAVSGHALLQLARNQKDRRQRRTEFMRGGGRQTVQLREMLFAGQYQLGGRQCVRELAGLLGHLECIKTGNPDRQQDREPDAEQVDRWQYQRLIGVPRQRQIEEDQHGGAGNGQRAERDRQPYRQRRRRNQNRGKEQK